MFKINKAMNYKDKKINTYKKKDNFPFLLNKGATNQPHTQGEKNHAFEEHSLV